MASFPITTVCPLCGGVGEEEDNAEDKLKIKFNKIKINENLNAIHFKGYNLPNTMDYEEWGEITERDDSGRIITIKKCNSKLHYEILSPLG